MFSSYLGNQMVLTYIKKHFCPYTTLTGVEGWGCPAILYMFFVEGEAEHPEARGEHAPSHRKARSDPRIEPSTFLL